MYREQDSPGSVGGCVCGSVVDGVLTHGTAAVEGGREGKEKKYAVSTNMQERMQAHTCTHARTHCSVVRAHTVVWSGLGSSS